MTEPRLPDVIERFLGAPVPPPDLASLREAARAAVRRRRRAVVGAAAAVLLIAGGGFAASTAYDGENRERSPEPASAPDPMPEPPPGTRWAGIGRVVIAVPEDWSDGETVCNQPTADTVYFPADVSRLCKVVGPHSSLAISDDPLVDRRGPADGTVDGYDVQTTRGCLKAADGPCFAAVSVPGLGAYFRITIRGTNAEEHVQRMRDSLTVLPNDLVAMPDVPLLISRPGQYEVTIAALEAAGLKPIVQDYGCMRNGMCADTTGVEPPPGRVVPVGTEITVTVTGKAATEPSAEDCPSCN